MAQQLIACISYIVLLYLTHEMVVFVGPFEFFFSFLSEVGPLSEMMKLTGVGGRPNLSVISKAIDAIYGYFINNKSEPRSASRRDPPMSQCRPQAENRGERTLDERTLDHLLQEVKASSKDCLLACLHIPDNFTCRLHTLKGVLFWPPHLYIYNVQERHLFRPSLTGNIFETFCHLGMSRNVLLQIPF